MVEEVQSVYTDLNNSNAKTVTHLDYETQKIRAGKKYFFFSHTIKKQPHNKILMQALIAKRKVAA